MKKWSVNWALVWTINLFVSAVLAEDPYQVAWSRQLGTSDSEYCHSVAVDGAGNAFICGYTRGSLGGPNEGYSDAFLAKYNPAGNLQWTKQLGASAGDLTYSMTVDVYGNAFISGYTCCLAEDWTSSPYHLAGGWIVHGKTNFGRGGK